jgi:hypothetical protein
MTPLEATAQLMQTWTVAGMMKGKTPEELRGLTLDLLTGIQGTLAMPKKPRKPKAKNDLPDIENMNENINGDYPWD